MTATGKELMTELQTEVKSLEKLQENIGKTGVERRTRSTIEKYELERAETWDKIVAHHNKIIAAQPPAGYQECSKK